ncbi:hypothetical protein [Streptomyces boninensis]|uniref:hypothetical protein n=1 Tax=Streptomyces boninensis TaxID=2039455 RepID=UPI003B21FE4C
MVDPAGLDEAVGRHDEAPVPEFGGLRRRVNRNDRAVTATVVAGNRLYGAGEFAADWGRRRTGRFLRAGERGAADRPAPRNGGGPAALDGPG